jgi:integrase
MSVRKITLRSGRTAYQARVQHGGQRRSAIRATREAAKTAEGNLFAALKAGHGPHASADEPEIVTVEDTIVLYGEDMEDRGKERATTKQTGYLIATIRRLLPALLSLPVSRLTDADVFAFRKARSVKARPSTVNRQLRILRAALRLVRPEYRFPKAFFDEDETRVRWLDPAQEREVLKATRQPFRSMVDFAALTLMRLTEIRKLRRDQVHLSAGILLLPRTKGKPRSVVLNQAASGILADQLDAHPDSLWVFPSPAGHFYSREHVAREFRKASRGIGLADFHFHDLRHHGATTALNAGFSSPIVQALGGWKTERMMRRYAAVTDQTLRKAAEAVAAHRIETATRVATPPRKRARS